MAEQAGAMPPLTYILDAERMRKRIATVLAVGLGGLAVLIGLLFPALALPRGTWQIALIAGILLLGFVVPNFYRPQDAEAWLRLDGEGLALNRRGRAVRWSWSELSAFRRRAFFHPATLVFGHCITIRAPVDGRRPPFQWLARRLFGEATVVIGNDYFTESDVIAEQLKRYSAAAAKGAPTRLFRGDQSSGQRPRIFRVRPLGPWWRRAAQILLRLLGATAAGIGLALLVVIKRLPGGWIWSDLVARADGIAVIAVVVALVVGLALYRDLGGARNFLMLSDDGLHLRRRGEHRLWPWHFVAPFELRTAAGRVGAAILFKGIGGGEEDSQGKLDPEERDEILNGDGTDEILFPVTIEDVYERPLAEILRALEAYRERALQAAGPATAG